MIVKNEEKYLDRCLLSVERLVDEMIIVDTGSTDRTIEIAHSHGAKVYHFDWIDDFAAARNYSLEQTSGDWILVIDADQYFAEDFADTIRAFVANPVNRERQGFIEITSTYMQEGQILKSIDFMTRLFPRGARFEGRIHEQVVPVMRRVDSGLRLMHDGYLNTDKGARNIPLLLLALEEQPDDAYLHFQLGKQYLGNKQNAEAERHLEIAYRHRQPQYAYTLENIVELLKAYAQNKHYEQALELVGEEVQLLDTSPDFCFAVALFLLDYAIDTGDHSVIANIENSYLKCLELGRNKVQELVVGTSTYLAAYNLAVFYEMTANETKAREHYQLAASYGYEPALSKATSN